MGLLSAPVKWKKVGKIARKSTKIAPAAAPAAGGGDLVWEIFQFFYLYNSRSTIPIRLKFVWELPRMLVSVQKNFGVMGLLSAPGIWEFVENPSKIVEIRAKIQVHRDDFALLWEIFRFFMREISRSTLPIRPKFVWELPRMLVSAQKNFRAMDLLSAPIIWEIVGKPLENRRKSLENRGSRRRRRPSVGNFSILCAL